MKEKTTKQKTDNLNWIFEVVEIEKIKEWDKNPRKIIQSKLNYLYDSIKKYGLPEPIVVNNDYVVIGGHARLEVLKSLKQNKVFCMRASKKLSETEIAELNVRLNKNIAGEFDFEKLEQMFDESQLKEIGFTEDELKEIIKKIENNTTAKYKIMQELNEEYDYVVIFVKNSVEKNNLFEILKIEKEKSYKSKHIGFGRVISYQKFMEIWEGRFGK